MEANGSAPTIWRCLTERLGPCLTVEDDEDANAKLEVADDKEREGGGKGKDLVDEGA